jgi:O-antigen ligase
VVGGHLRDAGSAIARPRLTAASSDRVEETRAALRAVRADPVLGVGQRHLDLSWIGPDGSIAVARYAHNEYLQVLAELGIVGLGLLLGVLVVAGRAVARGREVTATPEMWAGVTAALVALAVHGVFDFGWHVPVVPLTGALLCGLVTFPKRKETK